MVLELPKFFTDLDARDLLCCSDPATPSRPSLASAAMMDVMVPPIGAVRIAARDRRVRWPPAPASARLVASGASPSMSLDAKGITPVMLAVLGGHLDTSVRPL